MAPARLVTLQLDPTLAVDFRTRWLYRRDAEGIWRMVRLLSDWEIMQAEDQRDYGIVLDGAEEAQMPHDDDRYLLGEPMGWKAGTLFAVIMLGIPLGLIIYHFLKH